MAAMNWIKKHPWALSAGALLLLLAVLLTDSLITRLPAQLLTIAVVVSLVLEVVSFVMIRRNFNAELKKSAPDNGKNTFSHNTTKQGKKK